MYVCCVHLCEHGRLGRQSSKVVTPCLLISFWLSLFASYILVLVLGVLLNVSTHFYVVNFVILGIAYMPEPLTIPKLLLFAEI